MPNTFEDWKKYQGITMSDPTGILERMWQASRDQALEEAAVMMRTGKFCRMVEHIQDVCHCEEIAAAIRALKEEA